MDPPWGKKWHQEKHSESSIADCKCLYILIICVNYCCSTENHWDKDGDEWKEDDYVTLGSNVSKMQLVRCYIHTSRSTLVHAFGQGAESLVLVIFGQILQLGFIDSWVRKGAEANTDPELKHAGCQPMVCQIESVTVQLVLFI